MKQEQIDVAGGGGAGDWPISWWPNDQNPCRRLRLWAANRDRDNSRPALRWGHRLRQQRATTIPA
jgi:hypothetical protein